jgi:nucleoside phosphorylase
MIVSAGKSEVFDFSYPIGVGMVVSAINLTQLCLFDKPEFLLFVGSAGSYGEHNIFDIVESKGAGNIELSFLQDKSYSVVDNVIVR